MYDILSEFMIAFAVACTAQFFQFIQTQGQILQWYGDWWKKQVRFKRLLESYGYKRPLVSFLSYIAKPMGLCEYCNGTWIAIIYSILIGYNIFEMVLFIGVTYFFINQINKHKV